MDFESKGELSMAELKEVLLSEIKKVEKAPFGEPEFEKHNPMPS